MPLTQTDQEKVSRWLEEKCGNLRCSCCGFGRWSILDIATMPIGFNLYSTQFLYNQGVPQVTIFCTHCGHMLFFNPDVIGLLPKGPAQDSGPEQEEEQEP